MPPKFFERLIEKEVLPVLSNQPRNLAVQGHQILGTMDLLNEILAAIPPGDCYAATITPKDLSALIKRVSDAGIKARPLRLLTNHAISQQFRWDTPEDVLANLTPRQLLEKNSIPLEGDFRFIILLPKIHEIPRELCIQLLQGMKMICDDGQDYPGIIYCPIGAIDIPTVFRAIDDKTSPSSVFVQVMPEKLLLDHETASRCIDELLRENGLSPSDSIRTAIAHISAGCLGFIKSLVQYCAHERVTDGATLSAKLIRGLGDGEAAALAATNEIESIKFSPDQTAIIKELVFSRYIPYSDIDAIRELKATGILKFHEQFPQQLMIFTCPLIDWHFTGKYSVLASASQILSPTYNVSAYTLLTEFECAIRRYFMHLSKFAVKAGLPADFENKLVTARDLQVQEGAKLSSATADPVWSFLGPDEFLPLAAHLFSNSGDTCLKDWQELVADFNHFRRRAMHSRSITERELTLIQTLIVRLSKLMAKSNRKISL